MFFRIYGHITAPPRLFLKCRGLFECEWFPSLESDGAGCGRFPGGFSKLTSFVCPDRQLCPLFFSLSPSSFKNQRLWNDGFSNQRFDDSTRRVGDPCEHGLFLISRNTRLCRAGKLADGKRNSQQPHPRSRKPSRKAKGHSIQFMPFSTPINHFHRAFYMSLTKVYLLVQIFVWLLKKVTMT